MMNGPRWTEPSVHQNLHDSDARDNARRQSHRGLTEAVATMP